jgi:hypothetical protein
MAIELLGEVVTWSMGTAEVAAQACRDALRDAGLYHELPELKISTAFSRALKPIKEDDRVVRKRKDGEKGRANYQVNRVLEDGTIDYDYDCTLELDKETGRVECNEDLGRARELTREVQRELATRRHTDITRLVQTMFADRADIYPINPEKGVAYFVPHEHKEFCDRVQTFLRSVGGELGRFPVPKGTEEGNRSVQVAVRDGLTAVVNEVQELIDAWEPGKTRAGTMERHIAALEAKLAKAECHAEFLGSETEALKAAIEAKKAAAKARMAEILEAELAEEGAAQAA